MFVCVDKHLIICKLSEAINKIRASELSLVKAKLPTLDYPSYLFTAWCQSSHSRRNEKTTVAHLSRCLRLAIA